MRWRKTMSLAGVLALVSSAFSGCTSNRGSEIADDFAAYMLRAPEVDRVEGSGSNTLPFIGSASGWVWVTSGADASTVMGVVDRAQNFGAVDQMTRIRILVSSPGFEGTFELDPDGVRSHERGVVDLMEGFAQSAVAPGIEVTLADQDHGVEVIAYEVSINEARSADAALERLRGLWPQAAPVARIVIASDSVPQLLQGASFDQIAHTRAALAQIEADYSVIEATVDGPALMVRLDGDYLEEVSQQIIAAHPDLDVEVNFGTVTGLSDGDAEISELALAIEAAGAAMEVEVFDTWLMVHAASAEAALEVSDVVADVGLPDGAYIWFEIPGDDARAAVTLRSVTEGLDSWRGMLLALEGPVGADLIGSVQVHAAGHWVEVNVRDQPLNATDHANVAAMLAPVLPAGYELSVKFDSPERKSFSVIVQDNLGAGDLDIWGDPSPGQVEETEAFREAWNAHR